MLSPNQLAKMIGMSLTPVREAVLQLENEGLVEVIAKVGVRPRELARSALELPTPTGSSASHSSHTEPTRRRCPA